MTDPDAAGGGGEYEVVVGKSLFTGLVSPSLYSFLTSCALVGCSLSLESLESG
jgi:hypothetical protein